MPPLPKPLDRLPPYRRDKTAGALRHRITIQSAPETADSAGQMIQDWSVAADGDTVWGLFEPMGGFESEVAGSQVRSIITGHVTIRRYDGITPKMRLKVNGYGMTDLILNIQAVLPPDASSGQQQIIVRQPEPGVT